MNYLASMMRPEAEKRAAAAKKRPVELRLTFVQAKALARLLESYFANSHPSRERVSLAHVRDNLRDAKNAAA